MIVLVMDNAAESLRGEITKWCLEVKPGVFVGNLNAMVREKLWSKIEGQKSKITGALLVYSMNNEQGYSMKMLGLPHRQLVDFDGIQLVQVMD